MGASVFVSMFSDSVLFPFMHMSLYFFVVCVCTYVLGKLSVHTDVSVCGKVSIMNVYVPHCYVAIVFQSLRPSGLTSQRNRERERLRE